MLILDVVLDALDFFAELWLVNRSTTRADRRYARNHSRRNKK